MSKIIMPLRRERGSMPSFYIDNETRESIISDPVEIPFVPVVQAEGVKMTLFDNGTRITASDGSYSSYFSGDTRTYTIRNDGTGSLTYDVSLVDSVGKFIFVDDSGEEEILDISGSLEYGETATFYIKLLSLEDQEVRSISQVTIETNDISNNPFVFRIIYDSPGVKNTNDPTTDPEPVKFVSGTASVVSMCPNGMIKKVISAVNMAPYYSGDPFYDAVSDQYGLDCSYVPNARGMYSFDKYFPSSARGQLWMWNGGVYFFALSRKVSSNMEIWIGRIYSKNMNKYCQANQLNVPLYEGYYYQKFVYDSLGRTRIEDAILDSTITTSNIKKVLSAKIEFRNITSGNPPAYTYSGHIKGTMRLRGYPLTCNGLYSDVSFFAE